MFSDQSCVNRTEAVFFTVTYCMEYDMWENSLSFSVIWNWKDKYVHTLRSSLENHSRFQTKMGKAYSDQNNTKTLPGWAGHTYMALVRE